MTGPHREHRTILPLLLLLSMAACSEDPQKSLTAPVEPPPAAYPRSYLNQAINVREALRWQSLTVEPRITIRLSVNDVGTPAGFDGAFWRGAIPDMAEAWLNALRGDRHDIRIDLSYQSTTGPPTVSSSNAAVTIIEFIDRFTSRTAGTTEIALNNSSRCFYKETITIALRDSNGSAFAPSTKRAVFLHEFGHALGLFSTDGRTAHSPDSTDIMFPTISRQQNGLSEADKQTIQHLYSFTPRFSNCGNTGTSPPAKPTIIIVAGNHARYLVRDPYWNPKFPFGLSGISPTFWRQTDRHK